MVRGYRRTTPRQFFWNAAKASAWARNHRAHRHAHQQRMLATDSPTTLLAVAMTHYESGLGLDGRKPRPGTDRCSLPLLPYLRTGLLDGPEPRRSRTTSGTSDRSECRPYLDSRLSVRASSGPVSVTDVLRELGFLASAAVIPRAALELGNPGVCVPCTDSLRVLHHLSKSYLLARGSSG